MGSVLELRKGINSAIFFSWATYSMLLGACIAGNFHDDFTVIWSRENVLVDDTSRTVKLLMNEVAGASLASSSTFLFGSFSVKLKLIKGDSSGTVCSFYLTSYSSKHDEIDFEFLGNETGQPYVVHTNVFANGNGEREQRIFLWFDPTEDFHTYSLIWNHHQILWLIDGIPIRLHRNMESINPNSYPQTKPMVVAASIFDASTWATRGGTVPTKWKTSSTTRTLDLKPAKLLVTTLLSAKQATRVTGGRLVITRAWTRTALGNCGRSIRTTWSMTTAGTREDIQARQRSVSTTKSNAQVHSQLVRPLQLQGS